MEYFPTQEKKEKEKVSKHIIYKCRGGTEINVLMSGLLLMTKLQSKKKRMRVLRFLSLRFQGERGPRCRRPLNKKQRCLKLWQREQEIKNGMR